MSALITHWRFSAPAPPASMAPRSSSPAQVAPDQQLPSGNPIALARMSPAIGCIGRGREDSMATGISRSFPGGLWLWDSGVDPRKELAETIPGFDHVFFSPTRRSQPAGSQTQRNHLSGESRKELVNDPWPATRRIRADQIDRRNLVSEAGTWRSERLRAG